LVSAQVGGQTNLYLYPLEETGRGERVARPTHFDDRTEAARPITPDGREVFYLESGRVQIIPLDHARSPAPSM